MKRIFIPITILLVLGAPVFPSIAVPLSFEHRSESVNLNLAQGTNVQDMPRLMPGSSGQAVLVLEIALKQLGYYKGSLDGRYQSGFILNQAVKNFQANNGIIPDGIVGSQTWQSILSKWASK
jgi:peptidoglycan hydrolase-like protein with peptidoglycan-binding domain